jgi:NADH:ubiquinone oxidoreductase subunit F (NADH-binding)
MSGLPRLLDEHAGRRDARYRGAPLIDEVAAAGLRGRGGGAFPTAVKLRAVAGRRGRRAVVVNAAEGEPLSAKDRTLLELGPHLVLDGALLAAEAVGAREIVLAMKRSTPAAHAAVGRALAERRDADAVRVRIVEDAYLAGEETALIRSLDGGPMKPTLTPPRPDQRGLGRRPTLVSNAETLAHVALIGRYGARWFRELGTADHPGSALVTVDGAVERPAVYEIALGMPLAHVLATAGEPGPPRGAVLVGGYYGTWLAPGAADGARLDDGSLREHGAALGAGVIAVLPQEACPVAEVAAVVGWMARENAGQCGPCVHGLAAIAGALATLPEGPSDPFVLGRLARWSSQVQGRGACHHPDGVVRFLRSALNVFSREFEDHRRYGPCDACEREPVLLPGLRQAA